MSHINKAKNPLYEKDEGGMHKSLGMNRRLIIAGYLILIVITLSCNNSDNETINNINSKPYSTWVSGNITFDTSYTSENIITRINFLDSVSLRAVFKYDSDFSFLYPKYLLEWDVIIKDSAINFNTDTVDWANYFQYKDSILFYKFYNAEYYLLFNKPFYCNGYNCDEIGILILEYHNNKYVATRYYKSDYGNDSIMINAIIKESDKSESLMLPVFCQTESVDSICTMISIDLINSHNVKSFRKLGDINNVE